MAAGTEETADTTRLFVENPEITMAVDMLWEQFGHMASGTTLYWRDMEKTAGFGRDDSPGQTIFNKFRKRMLRERNIATRAVKNIGIQLLTPIEQVVICSEDRQRRAHRQCNRGIQEVGAVANNDIPLHVQRLRVKTVDTLRLARSNARRGVKEVVTLLRTETIPQRSR